MFDIFEYPNISSENMKELSKQINDYLTQFKETLEFALMNINTDNLSADLVAKLNSLGADIENTKKEQEDQIQQVSNKSLSVSDVINSEPFKAFEQSVWDDIHASREFTVNFETGNLEYTDKETE